MNAKAYLELRKQHEEEIANFRIAYAFSTSQFAEALQKLEATEDEVTSIWGHGEILRKTDVRSYLEMLKRHVKEIHELLKDEEIAEEAFLYEMDNHEYAINWDGDEDVLAVFALSSEELEEKGLESAYRRAKKRHMKHAMDWGMI